MTAQYRGDFEQSGHAATREVAALLSEYEGSLLQLEYGGRRLNGFVIGAQLAPDGQRGYDIILIMTLDRVIEGKCYVNNSVGRRVEAIGKTERTGNANRVTLRVKDVAGN